MKFLIKLVMIKFVSFVQPLAINKTSILNPNLPQFKPLTEPDFFSSVRGFEKARFASSEFNQLSFIPLSKNSR